jgi:hypothetical protein
MATATERAAIGAEEARMEGRGPGGRAAEAARNVATGRDNNVVNNGTTTVGDRGLLGHSDSDRHRPGGLLSGHRHGDVLGNTEEEFARLRTKTHITAEGDAYCPNPNLRDLPKEFETRVQVIQRYPEMRTVEKTDFVKEIHHEERTILVPRTRVVHDDVERIDRVPVVRQVPRTRTEIHYRTVTEEREVVDMVQEIEYVDVPRIELVPRVITEDVEERVIVPVVREVAVTRMVEVPTGNYCEAPVGSFINPGDFNLLHHKHGHAGGGLGGLLRRDKSSSSSSSSSSDDEGRENVVHNADGTVTPRESRKKKSLLRRVLHQ